MVTMGIFTTGMNKLAQRWKEINKLGLDDRYFAAISSLPESAFKEIIYNFLDSAQKMPLPKDFNEAAKEWRNRFFKENGFYYGSEKSENEETPLDCQWCFDTGVLKVLSHDEKEWKLFSCDCEQGGQNVHLFPIWSNELLGAFKKTKLNPEWFKPAENNDAGIFSKAMEWMKIKHKQAELWKAIGYDPLKHG